MSYYFPFGTSAVGTVENIPYALTAVSASAILHTILVPTASRATSVQNTPSAGPSGISQTEFTCTDSGQSGLPGADGLQGGAGVNAVTCPQGTKECPGLFVSLSAVNSNRDPSSQFSIVCIDLAGNAESSITCPDYLPTSSGWTLPTIP